MSQSVVTVDSVVFMQGGVFVAEAAIPNPPTLLAGDILSLSATVTDAWTDNLEPVLEVRERKVGRPPKGSAAVRLRK